MLAAISGLTFIAYRHPNGYKKLVTPMLILGLVITLGILLGAMTTLLNGVSRMAEALARNPDLSLKEVRSTITMLVEDKDVIQKIILFAVPSVAYLTFLWHLPKIVGDTDDNERKG